MEARFSGCAVVSHWLLHTLVQISFCLIFVAQKSVVLSFLFEYTNWSFGSDFPYNSSNWKKFSPL